MRDISKAVRESFLNELLQKGDFWRIFRKGTLVDLIKLEFFAFQKDGNENHLIEIFNICMKIKLLSRINSIRAKGTFDEVYKQFNQEQDFILNQYDTVFKELEPILHTSTHASIYDLYGKIQYIKVINALEIDSYTDDIFEEIIGITYTILEEDD